NRLVVVQRNGTRIKETAAVVELNLPDRRGRGRGSAADIPGQFPAVRSRGVNRVLTRAATELSERKINLRGYRSGRHCLRQGILPKVAHQAVPRAFAIGQKNRRDGHKFT